MNIPLAQPWLDQAETEAATQVIESGWITEGPCTAEFGAKLNALIGSPYGVFAPNGTLALYLGLAALGLGPGDEVLVPDVTFIASANAVILAGATPVFAEVNRYNFQLDVAYCAQLVTPRTRAIMPVHLYGMAANMTEIMAFARRHNLLIVEDAAQAIGVKYGGQHVGTFGEAGCFSFFADKTVTTGEGGYVVCRDLAIYQRLQALRNHGRITRGRFIHPELGYNFRFTDIQAAIGLAQLRKLDLIVERKHAITAWYRRELSSVRQIQFLTIEPGSDYIPFRMVLICDNALQLIRFLVKRGIQARTVFYPLHRQPCFARLNKENGCPLDLSDALYPNAIFSYQHSLALPAFPLLTEEQVGYICFNIKNFYTAGIA